MTLTIPALPGLLGLHRLFPTSRRTMVRHCVPHPHRRSTDAVLDHPRHDRTWSQFFETFEQFLAFSWPVITVTDTRTGRAHIVTRMSSISAFLKMIKSR